METWGHFLSYHLLHGRRDWPAPGCTLSPGSCREHRTRGRVCVAQKAELLCCRVLWQYCKGLSLERETNTYNSLHEETVKSRPAFVVDCKKISGIAWGCLLHWLWQRASTGIGTHAHTLRLSFPLLRFSFRKENLKRGWLTTMQMAEQCRDTSSTWTSLDDTTSEFNLLILNSMVMLFLEPEHAQQFRIQTSQRRTAGDTQARSVPAFLQIYVCSFLPFLVSVTRKYLLARNNTWNYSSSRAKYCSEKKGRNNSFLGYRIPCFSSAGMPRMVHQTAETADLLSWL